MYCRVNSQDVFLCFRPKTAKNSLRVNYRPTILTLISSNSFLLKNGMQNCVTKFFVLQNTTKFVLKMVLKIHTIYLVHIIPSMG